MSNKKVGDRVRSTNTNTTPVTAIEGTIIEIDGREDYDGNIIEAEFALVEQDDGRTEWWSL